MKVTKLTEQKINSKLNESTDNQEWKQVCKEFCKQIGAELLFVNDDNFGYEDKNGRLVHMYADELEGYLQKRPLRKGGVKESKLTEGSVTYPREVQSRGRQLTVIENESDIDNLDFSEFVKDGYENGIKKEMKRKYHYFEDYLSPATKAARCGWPSVKLVVSNDASEYLAMCGSETFNLDDCKLINVSGNSLGACLEELGRNIF